MYKIRCSVSFQAVKAVIMRYGYCGGIRLLPTTQLWPILRARPSKACSLPVKSMAPRDIEEAAGQGLLAGTNAACKVLKTEPFVPNRDEAYLGVLSMT